MLHFFPHTSCFRYWWRAFAPVVGAALWLAAPAVQAQTGIGTTTPHPSAALDVSSTNKGLLLPRLTQAQREAIGSPAPGLVVYQTDNAAGPYVYGGTTWVPVGADNLGSHTATQNLNLGANLLTGGGTAGLALDNAGQAGLGTPAPTARLDVRGPGGLRVFTTNDGGAASAADWFSLFGGRSGTAMGRVVAGTLYGRATVGGHLFNAADGIVNWGDLMLNPEGPGNVGIGTGTTAPAQKLTVGGQVYSTTGGFRFPDNTVQTTAAAPQTLTLMGQNLSISGGNAVTLPLGADNLGNHTATQNLNLGTNQLVGNGGTAGLAVDAAGDVGIGTTSPAASAALDVASTQKGVLIPRLTQAQRDAISAPATGLQIFNTTTTRLNFWDGVRWQELLGTGTGKTTGPAPPTVTFGFTGAPQTYTVPEGVRLIKVTATGGTGADLAPSLGGTGAQLTAYLAVTPGEVLTAVVGQRGFVAPIAAYNGGGRGNNSLVFGITKIAGGGGGATDLRRAPANGPTGDYLSTRNALVVAGGGGGAGASPTAFFGTSNGGWGGLPVGGTGAAGLNGSPGQGATQAGPGAGGASGGNAGTGPTGGDGSFIFSGPVGGSGGGGGGYYGGGGGSDANAGGGGGSSWAMAGSSPAYALSVRGDGSLVIEPVSAPTAVPDFDASNLVNAPWGRLGTVAYNMPQVAGRVGIGTMAPTQLLDVAGTAVVSGPVGIGTTVPAQALDVQGTPVTATTLGTTPLLRVGRPGTIGSKFPSFFEIGVGTYAAGLNSLSRADFSLTNGAVGAPDATVLTLQGDGNVGIGTTAPAVRLDVNGGTPLTATTTTPVQVLRLTRPGMSGTKFPGVFEVAIGSYATGLAGQTRADFNLVNGQTGVPDMNLMTLRADGRVGINTLAPTASLHVTGTGVFTSDLGIGTTTPLARLDVRGTGGIRAYTTNPGTGAADWFSSFGGQANTAMSRVVTGTLFGTATVGGHLFNADNSVNNWAPLALNPGGGNVGIGTSTPAERLHVANGNAFIDGNVGVAGTLEVSGNRSLGVINYAFYANSGTNPPLMGVTTDSPTNISLVAAGRVVANQFNARSDARLKTIVGLSDRTADLALLNQLRITDYRMRDRAAYGERLFKKVIAQEVEAVFPQAVNRQTGFLPDVYAVVKGAVAEADSVLVLTLPQAAPAGAKAGQRVKLVGLQGEVVAAVAAAPTGPVLRVRTPQAAGLAGGQVFVFGLEHADVRTVDYEALSMLNVSATQELARLVAELQQQNAALRQRADRAEAATTSFEARLRALEAGAGQARK